ncbi:hypothetical protein [Rhizobium leguminosarum]|uniref:hypothetical protein n=1 Tax=Rhizobium leguminosarum TaxID=384 RepID=UPI0021BBFB3A|nr:hypothetical protein [Rhizobium leguminosarum]
MFRLGLSTRILGIGVTFLLSAWIALVALYYWSNGLSRISTYPSATQILMIADVLSDAEPQEREKLVMAVSSSVLIVEMEPNRDVSVEPNTREHLEHLPEFSHYRNALGGRLISIRRLDAADSGARRPRLFGGAINPTEFRVRLNDGVIARLQTKTPFIVTLFGLPAGLAPVWWGRFLRWLPLYSSTGRYGR